MTCIPPTLEGWVYIMPIHGPLDGPLYTRAQYTPNNNMCAAAVQITALVFLSIYNITMTTTII